MSGIQEVRQIHNPQRAYEWEFEVQGSPVDEAAERLVFYAQSVSIPEKTNETFEINYKSDKTGFSGRNGSPRTFTVTFFDDESLTVYRFFRAWLDLINNEELGGGTSRAIHSADSLIRQLAVDSEQVTATHRMIGSFPTSIGEVSLSYENNEPMNVEVTFYYQRHSFEV